MEEQQVDIEEFSKISLKVGQIVSAEKIEKSKKLIKLSINLGEDAPRQVLAGVALHYTPEVLVGRRVAVVANLKPASLMGHNSEGMVLAASSDNGTLRLVEISPDLPVGSEIR